MKTTYKMFSAAALVVAMSLPAAAQMDQIDGSLLTCGEYMAMDASGRSNGANALTTFATDAANVDTGAIAAEVIKGLETSEIEQLIESKCSNQPETVTVLSVMSKT